MIDWSIIKKVVDKKANRSEQQMFEQWLNKSPKHSSYMQEIYNYYNQADRGFIPKNNSELQARLDALKHSVQRKRQSSAKRRFITVTAVSAAVLLFISFIIFNNTQPPQSLVAELPVPVEPIGNITDKVTIVVEGKEYDVESDNTEIVSAVKINNSTLTYYNTISTSDAPAKIEYHTLKVPSGKDFRLVLSEGSVVWLNGNSELRFPTHFAEDAPRVVELKGEGYFEVSKSDISQFIVNTSNDVCVKVYGTKFNINAYSSEAVHTVLLSGSVSVTASEGGNEVFVTPNHVATVQENGDIKLAECDASDYTLWMQGVLLFEKSTLHEIFQRLADIYSIKVVWESEEYKNEIFYTKVPKTTDITTIIEAINRIEKAECRLEHNTVYIK